MRINTIDSMVRGNQIFGFGGSRAEKPSSLLGRVKGDQLTLSEQVLAIIQHQNKIREIEERAGNSPEAQAVDNLSKAMKVLKVCSKIAARIRAGDKVPLKDLQYLMRNDPQAYRMAMASRKPKDAPKEWESAVPKDEQAERQSIRDLETQVNRSQALSEAGNSAGMSSDGSFVGGAGENSVV